MDHVPTVWQVLEDRISALPWLEEMKQKREEDDHDNEPVGKFGEPAFKPYKSGSLRFIVSLTKCSI